MPSTGFRRCYAAGERFSGRVYCLTLNDFIGSSRMALFGSSGVYRSWMNAHVSESSKDYIAGRLTLEDRRMNYVYKELKWISVRNDAVLSRSSTSSQLPVG
ncbi:hypothetical protein EJB05_18340, partial [Eragrostis curvula]